MSIIRCDDVKLLHPQFVFVANSMAQALVRAYETGLTKSLFKPFETYRDPRRQQELLVKRRTKARPWQSKHQYGLAIDFVPKQSGWSWSEAEDWDFLDEVAKGHGLVRPIKWDRPHIEHPLANEWLKHLK